MADTERLRHPVALTVALVLVTAGIALALATSEPSGTGAANVGRPDEEPATAQDRGPRGVAPAPGAGEAVPERAERPRRCEPTETNPGGDNNYIPGAPEVDSLGDGFVISGRVRAARGCEPLEDLPIQVWLATETGGEEDNRAIVRTDAGGGYRIETARTVPQFGEPNIHVAYDGDRYRSVFIRRVVDLEDRRAVVDLTLAGG